MTRKSHSINDGSLEIPSSIPLIWFVTLALTYKLLKNLCLPNESLGPAFCKKLRRFAKPSVKLRQPNQIKSNQFSNQS